MTAVQIDGGRFAVVGGASLVGSHIVRALLAEGAAQVTIVDNFSLAGREAIATLLERSDVKLVQADVVRLDELLPAFAGVDGICHAAGLLTSVLGPRPGLGLEVNIGGTLNVLAAAQASGARKVVLSSTVGVYGSSAGRLDETTPFNPAGMGPATALYTLSKLLGEQLCALYSSRGELGTVALRYSSIYGPGLHTRGLNTSIFLSAHERILAGEPPEVIGDGEDRHDYVYAGDVAAANVCALRAPITGEAFTIATGTSTSVREAIEIMLDLCGRSDLGIESRRTEAPTYHPPGDTGYSLEKAKRLLGWEPQVDLRTGMRQLLEWMDASTARSSV
jgi:UDP-glucose 4-epimerase